MIVCQNSQCKTSFASKLFISWNPICWISIKCTVSINLLICILFARMNATLLAADRVIAHSYNMPMVTSERDWLHHEHISLLPAPVLVSRNVGHNLLLLLLLPGFFFFFCFNLASVNSFKALTFLCW